MKNASGALLLILGSLLTAFGQGTESVPRRAIDPTLPKTPPVYELRCRGGKMLTTNGPHDLQFSRVTEKTTASGEVIYKMMLFSRAQTERAAGMDGSGLGEGSCAWIDRPLNTNEYSTELGHVRISFETPANSQLKQKLHGEPIDTSPTAAERYPDALTIPEYLKDPTHCWSFFGVFNPGGYFQVSYHKYWKNDPNVYVPRAPVDLKKVIKP